MGLLKNTIGEIKEVDREMLVRAQKRLDMLTKPRGSLGRLEEYAKRVCAATNTDAPRITDKVVFTFAGDHGVASEGVSAFPAEVTPQMVFNFLNGGAAINALARHVGARVVVVDMGVNFDFDDAPGLVKEKVVRGTGNIRKGPAMTRDEAVRCMEAGIRLALENAAPGALFGTGDMGIANTTPSSAIAAAFSKRAVNEVTGRGTGIDDAAFAHKVRVIEDALEINRPDPADAIDVLSKVGGAEIAAIAGLVLGAASRRVPVVIDGFISTAGALAASVLAPGVKDYLFAGHKSVERGHAVMLEMLGLKPSLDLDMRLGEGTGAVLAMSVIEAGVKIYNEMATFNDAGVSEEGA
jgi:nicotinate-nucleotide--dimethylbenzimidazole phosphoribosyltransferase